MIITETLMIDEREFTKAYSDEGRYVVRDGISYEEAYDPSEFHRTYTEGDMIPETFADDREILRIMLGEEEGGGEDD